MQDVSWYLVWMLLMMVTFIGIVFWAWSSRRRKDFKEAAHLPLEEDKRGRKSTPENGESR